MPVSTTKFTIKSTACKNVIAEMSGGRAEHGHSGKYQAAQCCSLDGQNAEL